MEIENKSQDISDFQTKCSIRNQRNDEHIQTGTVFDGTILPFRIETDRYRY